MPLVMGSGLGGKALMLPDGGEAHISQGPTGGAGGSSRLKLVSWAYARVGKYSQRCQFFAEGYPLAMRSTLLFLRPFRT